MTFSTTMKWGRHTFEYVELVERAENFMKDERLAYESIKPFSTPRRLAVLISGVAEKAEDFTEEVKGPAKKAALDAEGNYSKAAVSVTWPVQLRVPSLMSVRSLVSHC
ncbi:glycine--tRNA ligase subunit beta [Weissella confusa]|uniref:glycine--tRNA ligase n=1 Tax=Weissella confusa TaxID=1583 RepID=A0A923SPW2_WEICO|nr:glycine--tRNA ligase subunit beta [Weissella confusa]